MATAETNIVNDIMKDVSPSGTRLFRNVRGLFLTPDGRQKILAGLIAPGASDLVGFRPIKITQEMVGQTIAVFVSIEAKTKTGYPSKEQRHFIDFIRENGGFAGVARSKEDARKILKIDVDNPASGAVD